VLFYYCIITTIHYLIILFLSVIDVSSATDGKNRVLFVLSARSYPHSTTCMTAAPNGCSLITITSVHEDTGAQGNPLVSVVFVHAPIIT